MRLRSGRVYSYRYQDHLERRRADRKLKKKMSPPIKTGSIPTTSASQQNPVLTVVNARSAIVPFAGRVNGFLSQGVESWISSVDVHLTAKSITDPSLQLQEAKSFIDYAKGDAGAYLRGISFKETRTWDDFKINLRSIYGSEDALDEVLALRNIIKVAFMTNLSLVDRAALIGDRLEEYKGQVNGSSWVDGNLNFSSGAVCRLFYLTLITAMLPEPLIKCFDEKLTAASTELQIYKQIRKHLSKCTDIDPSLVQAFTKQENKNQASTSQQNVNLVNSTGSAVTCFNCKRPGHMITDCRTRYCSIHNTSNHTYSQCNVRKKNSNSNTNNQSANNDVRRNQYHGGKSKQYKQNSNVGQKQVQINRSSAKSSSGTAISNNQVSANFPNAGGQANNT